MTTNSKLPEICKEAFAQAREKLGLSAKDLGGMACLSTRQIEQIESGETSSFYGAQIKVTAAKKVAKLLNLSDEEAFDFGTHTPEKISTSAVELPIAEAKLVKTAEAEAKKNATKVSEQVEGAELPAVVAAEENKEPAKKVQAKEGPFARTVAKAKPSSRKKLFLWLSVLATLVFSVINLQPLFFADKPEEIVIVKEEVIEPAPSSAPVGAPIESVPAAAPVVVAAAPAIATDAPGACPAEEGIISYKPESPRKPADLVYVQTKSKQTVCVIDASGKIQNKLLEPGVGASFYGKPPFKVLTTGLSQVDVFFQGAKVRLSNPNSKTVILEAAEVVAPPADGTESQLR
ncbi:helix-turn-helix transcriptional regulator [Polynucleobacter sp. AM-25C3]|uniref:helix-turn-helix domain-containing protein n=1 Tax=Polynucleobacter sp. AM-25C3 TaxID=1855569 RepID=UPI001C0BF39B|nr:helix-turn-helix transcriptional regulator [Polynucleobacter sp. AM-25C3]